MYVSILITYLSGFSMYSFFFSIFSFLFFLPLFSFVPPFSLFTVTPFYTIYRGGIFHFYPSTAFGSSWTSFQDYLLAYQLLNHYHYFECVGCTTLHPKQNCLSCFLPLSLFFTSLVKIRIKPLHYLHLWHASSGLNLYLPLLGEIPSQQDISPQRSSSRNPKIDPLFLPTTRPHPLKALTHDPPSMYWLGTSRWCLALSVCSTPSKFCFFLAFTPFLLPLCLFNSIVRIGWCLSFVA